jgi:probable phosphoglycerate mutase
VGDIVLIRHGQTEWSASGRHTSYTDLPLTELGEQQARALRPALAGRRFVAVLSSPRQRSLDTARLAGIEVTGVEDDLAEWDYGEYEGITSAQIHEQRPDWSLWRDGCPGGESPEQVGDRLDRLLAKARELAAEGDVALIGHGHSLRVAGARWVDLSPSAGAVLVLHTATVSTLGFEHKRPAIVHWNVPVEDQRPAPA